jgi:hypothetical protein
MNAVAPGLDPAEPAGARRPDTTTGVVLISASAVAYSSAGFFTRLIDVDVWTLIFWRGLFSTLFLLTAVIVRHRRAAMSVVRSLDRAAAVRRSRCPHRRSRRAPRSALGVDRLPPDPTIPTLAGGGLVILAVAVNTRMSDS